MPKLTDTQLVILSTASQRDDGAALPLPKSLKLQGSAVGRVLKSLLNKGLLAEQSAGNNAAAWRESKDGQRLTLVIADAGRAAIGVPADMQKNPQPTPTAESTTKRSEDRGRGAAGSKRSAKAKSEPKATASRASARSGTKQALLVDLLRRKEGATIAEAVKATGWQPHSAYARSGCSPWAATKVTSVLSAATAAHPRRGARRSRQNGRNGSRWCRDDVHMRRPERSKTAAENHRSAPLGAAD